MGSENRSLKDSDISLDNISSIDDMSDKAGDTGKVYHSDFVESKLRKYQSILIPIYEQANTAAIKYQSSHSLWMKAFIFATTVAVLLALLQMYEPIIILLGWNILLAEGLVLGFGIFAIIYDMGFGKFHQKWIIERHKAERCRFLKFYDLLFDDNAYFDQEISLIKKIKDFSFINNWIEERGQNSDKVKKLFYKKEISHVEDIFNYFMCRRLFVQMNYFLKRYRENREKKELWTQKIPLFLVCVAFLLAFFHIGWEFYQGPALKGNSLLSVIGISLLLLVIVFPIIVWTLNSLSVIFPYRANSGRYAAIYISVKDCLNNELFRHNDSEIEKIKEKTGNYNDRNRRDNGDFNVFTESQYLKELIRKFCISPLSNPLNSLNSSSEEVFLALLCLEDQLEREHEEWIRLTRNAISL
jgi:hypothetical protein